MEIDGTIYGDGGCVRCVLIVMVGWRAKGRMEIGWRSIQDYSSDGYCAKDGSRDTESTEEEKFRNGELKGGQDFLCDGGGQ